MNQLIIDIRKQLQLTQEQMATKLGTSAVTVNRWENNKSKPNLMAQKQIYQLCKEENVDLTHIIIKQYEKKDCLYHASRRNIIGNIQPISRSNCDFGKGFYMGENPLQLLTLVCREEKPTFYTIKVDLTNLKCLEIDIGLEWALLISFFRGYMNDYRNTEIYNKYANMTKDVDLVVGYIADDRMYQVLTDFFEGTITDQALIHALSALKLGKQCVALTQKACNQITILNEKEISHLELLALKDISSKRRKKGLEVADEGLRMYRRTGYFYDEILRGENHG